MTKTYYEAHVTFRSGDDFRSEPRLQRIVEGRKWKFSAISGDANLGPGRKLYATRQFPTRVGTERVIRELHCVADALAQAGAEVLRRKVEEVIFDDRSEKVQCLGGCQECVGEDLGETVLPCDVQLPGALLRRGVKFSVLMTALERRREWGEEETTLRKD